MKKYIHRIHPFFRCVDSAIFFDFVEYVLRFYKCELFELPQDQQLYLFSRFRLLEYM